MVGKMTSGIGGTDIGKKLFMKNIAEKGAAANWVPSWGKLAIAGAGALPFLMGSGDDDDEDDKFDYEGAKNAYRDELMRIKAGAMAGSLDPNKFNYLGVKDGGRIGHYKGGQSIPSDFTLEDATISTTQDKLGGITDVMKQADLFRSGDVGQFYAAQGGRSGYGAGGKAGRPPINLIKGNDQPAAQAPAPMSPNQNKPMNQPMNPMMARGKAYDE